MKALTVIGANFGDEGKGLFVDYLAENYGDVVVRFNGGAQAGHTVVTPDGRRHIFRHFGSGTFHGVPTYLSEFFVCNPILFFKEWDDLKTKINFVPDVYAHPKCAITTFADMIINQRLENRRGAKRHGSCGVGFAETISRQTIPEISITMGDLWNGGAALESKIAQICDKYARFRTGEKIDYPAMTESFIKGCEKFAEAIQPLGIEQCTNPIFEGAQGLLLDQGNKKFFPHLTRSNTGMKNVRELCSKIGKDIDHEIFYITRSYLTRHGAGPLPGEGKSISYEDKTNITNQFQGQLRFGFFDSENIDDLMKRCAEDSGGANFKLAITHCDQKSPQFHSDYYVSGETRNHVEEFYEKDS